MPYKVCSKCSTNNGVRSKNCKVCGASFEKSKPSMAVVRGKTEEKQARTLDKGSYLWYSKLLQTAGLAFMYTGEEPIDNNADLVKEIKKWMVAYDISEADIKEFLNTPISKMWK